MNDKVRLVSASQSIRQLDQLAGRQMEEERKRERWRGRVGVRGREVWGEGRKKGGRGGER